MISKFLRFLTRASRYEELLYRVDATKYNEKPGLELLSDLQSYIDEHNKYRPYAVHLQANLRLRMGPRLRKELCQSDFGALIRCAYQGKNYSAAARWTWANLIISDLGKETNPALKLEGYRKALAIVSKLQEWTKLDVPVLLHGILSEAPPGSAAFNSKGIPGTRFVPVPFRIQVAYRLMIINCLMSDDISQALQYCRESEYFCRLSLRAYGENQGQVSTNIFSAQSVNDGLQQLMSPQPLGSAKLITQFEGLIEKTKELEKKGELTHLKSIEWQASSMAGIATFLDADSEEHRKYLEGVQQHMKIITDHHGSSAIFLTTDPFYARAHQTPEEKEQFEKLLEPLRIDREPRIVMNTPKEPDPVFERISLNTEELYIKVLNQIIRFGKNMESSKGSYEDYNEEKYRNHLVNHLNALAPWLFAKGEVFNRDGKTDILVANNKGDNVLIAECKLWKGQTYLRMAIDQLLKKYVNWRDGNLAIIIFNRDVRKFSGVIETATKTIQSHPLYKTDLGQREGTSYSYLFCHPNDKKRTLKLELVLFNFT